MRCHTCTYFSVHAVTVTSDRALIVYVRPAVPAASWAAWPAPLTCMHACATQEEFYHTPKVVHCALHCGTVSVFRRVLHAGPY